MARTKATPVRRAVSEEFFSREMQSRKRSDAVASVDKRESEEGPAAKKDAGFMEVAIAVGGIYASL